VLLQLGDEWGSTWCFLASTLCLAYLVAPYVPEERNPCGLPYDLRPWEERLREHEEVETRRRNARVVQSYPAGHVVSILG
jgi:hypothetical protein